jgi:hypothetical protein
MTHPVGKRPGYVKAKPHSMFVLLDSDILQSSLSHLHLSSLPPPQIRSGI